MFYTVFHFLHEGIKTSKLTRAMIWSLVPKIVTNSSFDRKGFLLKYSFQMGFQSNKKIGAREGLKCSLGSVTLTSRQSAYQVIHVKVNLYLSKYLESFSESFPISSCGRALRPFAVAPHNLTLSATRLRTSSVRSYSCYMCRILMLLAEEFLQNSLLLFWMQSI